MSLILIYFALIHHEIYSLGDKIISISSIFDSINDFAKLGFNCIDSIYTIHPSYLIPFLSEIYQKKVEDLDDSHKIYIEYNQTFKKKLENYIKTITIKIPEVRPIESITSNDIIIELKLLALLYFKPNNFLTRLISSVSRALIPIISKKIEWIKE